MTVHRLIAATTAVLFLTGGLAGTASASSTSADEQTTQARCSDWKGIDVPGGQIVYQECKRTKNGVRQRGVRGVVNDQKDGNGRCVYASIEFVPSGKTFDYRDCGGEQTRFSTGYHRGDDARVFGDG